MKNQWIRERHGAGHSIFKEGDIGQKAYLIERGVVSITSVRNGQFKEVARLGEGDMFGEIALIDQRPRTADATALEETTLIPISRDHVIDKLKQSDPLLSYLLEVVVDRWRESLGLKGGPATRAFASGDETRDLKSFAIKQLRIAQNLSDGLGKGELLVFYQPVVHLHNLELAGFEALVRWNTPDRGMVSPAEFIEVAENTGLIVPMGRWVLETALAALPRFQSVMDAHHPGRERLFMSINVSARQLQEESEVVRIIDSIRASGVDTRHIKLEVTESALINNPESAAQALHALKSLGLLLAIDDFGTGYSSLSYLSQYPLDNLKIDQSFVFKMQEEAGSLRITKAIASMAHDLEMKCIAEGVERESDVALLRDMRVAYGQGYFFSKPCGQEQAEQYIRAKGGAAA